MNKINFLIIIILLKNISYLITETTMNKKIKINSIDSEKLKNQLLKSLNNYQIIRGSNEFLENIGENNKQKNKQKLFLDAQTTLKGNKKIF
jgi:hypothetical protein